MKQQNNRHKDEPNPKELVVALNSILMAYEKAVKPLTVHKSAFEAPFDHTTKSVLADMISKAVVENPASAQILLLRCLNLGEKDLYKLLLESNVSPNFIVPKDYKKSDRIFALVEHSFSKDVVVCSVQLRDAEWLKLAVAHGMTGDPADPALHSCFIDSVFRYSCAGDLKSIFSAINLMENPPVLEEAASMINNGSNGAYAAHGYRSSLDEMVLDIYKSHYARQVLGNGEPHQTIHEIDMF